MSVLWEDLQTLRCNNDGQHFSTMQQRSRVSCQRLVVVLKSHKATAVILRSGKRKTESKAWKSLFFIPHPSLSWELVIKKQQIQSQSEWGVQTQVSWKHDNTGTNGDWRTPTAAVGVQLINDQCSITGHQGRNMQTISWTNDLQFKWHFMGLLMAHNSRLNIIIRLITIAT